MPLDLDRARRRIMQLEIERTQVAKDKAARARRDEIDEEISRLREDSERLSMRWAREKDLIVRVSSATERLEALRGDLERAERYGEPRDRRSHPLRRHSGRRAGDGRCAGPVGRHRRLGAHAARGGHGRGHRGRGGPLDRRAGREAC
ncbi:hypothetical protein GCM10025876_06350 [Demequina litorisediminis]|uniref:Uncharacterized protein n=1 Tax=Demequina litorisediminis TaxID=1849022 RepID=A0ABQ6IAF0_9MICO|nr:hypothetical protein GCM10025876_06350 [Demequina litorisediminis]